MAKVEITVDTESKEVVAKIDGKKVGSIGGIYISTEESGYFCLDISQYEMIDETTRKVTTISADRNVEDEQDAFDRAKANAKPSLEFPGMFKFTTPQFTTADLSQLLFGRDRT